MQASAKKIGIAAGLCLVAIAVGLNASAAFARSQAKVSVAAANPQVSAAEATDTEQRPVVTQKSRLPYFVDFRARTAASYGHAFVWYGRTGDRKVEVAGLHPATDSVVPYILGHVVPVPAETGASYGDLDEDYLLASYRIYLTEAEARLVFAYIKQKQRNSPLWNAGTYNCIVFIADIAKFMGLRVPGSHLLYPDDWVKSLVALNGGRKTARMAVAQ